MLEVSRTVTIQAAHSLPHVPDGHKCKNLHGHTWEITVWFTGEVHPTLMWVADFSIIDFVLRAAVYDKLDHTTLNERIPNPTCEAIACWVYAEVSNHDEALAGLRITTVDVCEGGRGRARLTAEGAGQ